MWRKRSRRYYEYIAKDKEWCKNFDDRVNNSEYRGFETKITQIDRDEIRKNPDIILNYNFDQEVEKVRNDKIRTELYRVIEEYKGKPLLDERRKMPLEERRNIFLAERRELIKMIELAKAGGNPFFKRKSVEGPGGEDR